MQMAHDATIGIMTYNILVGGREGRLAATEAVIRQMSPDIVGIQEASDPDNIRAMADRLGDGVRDGDQPGWLSRRAFEPLADRRVGATKIWRAQPAL